MFDIVFLIGLLHAKLLKTDLIHKCKAILICKKMIHVLWPEEKDGHTCLETNL